MDFIKLYWISLLLIIVGICIPIFKLVSIARSTDRKKKLNVLLQGSLLVSFGIYLLITKMFLDKTLGIIFWLLGTYVVVTIIRKLKKKELDQNKQDL